MPNLALLGYGKMGRLIEQLAPEFGFTVTRRIDEFNAATETLSGVDVAIEFSVPGATVENIRKCVTAGVPIVVGTTGWTDRLPEVKELVEQSGGALVWSPNYSVGVNLFFELVRTAAGLMAREPDYEAWAWEIHHSAKKDAPSGTLLKLVDEMKGAGFNRAIDTAASRAGAHPGTHEIGFDSLADNIVLRHTARNREGFARGALKAAQWIQGKRGFHEFPEVLFGLNR